MICTLDYLKETYKQYNEKYFDGLLPDIMFEVKNLGKTTRGRFCYSGFAPTNPNRYKIVINNNMDRNEYNLNTTILHEMIHCYIHYMDLAPSYEPAHGETFQHYAYVMNEKSGLNVTTYSNDIPTFVKLSTRRIIVFHDIDRKHYYVSVLSSKLPYDWFFEQNKQFVFVAERNSNHEEIQSFKRSTRLLHYYGITDTLATELLGYDPNAQKETA